MSSIPPEYDIVCEHEPVSAQVDWFIVVVVVVAWHLAHFLELKPVR